MSAGALRPLWPRGLGLDLYVWDNDCGGLNGLDG